jgi:hypothetical protein
MNKLEVTTFLALRHQLRLCKQYDCLFNKLITMQKHSARYMREYKKAQYLESLVKIGDVRLATYKNLLFNQ